MCYYSKFKHRIFSRRKVSTKVIMGNCRSRYDVESYSSVLSAERMVAERTTWSYVILGESNHTVKIILYVKSFECVLMTD